MKTKKAGKAFILLSGGQDSFACLLWAEEQFREREALSIDYGQRHIKEVKYAQEIARRLSVPHTVYAAGDLLKATATSSLLGKEESHNRSHVATESLPASFVPNRNGLLLSIAASHAYRQKERPIHLVIGACETDYSGYPDCRDTYLKAKAVELSLGLDCPVYIHAPLMWINKAGVFAMIRDGGRLEEVREWTLTCYDGEETLHPWGRGCGACPACRLRKNGFATFSKTHGST